MEGTGPISATAWPRTAGHSTGTGELVRFVRPLREAGERRGEFSFTQLHVEVARNATGDFNPFHDPVRWRQVRNNRFGAPIVLGFQLEMLLAHAVTERHLAEGDAGSDAGRPGRFASFRFTFADVVRVGEPVEVEVKPTRRSRRAGGTRTNRVLLRKRGRPVVTGRVEYLRERPAGLGLDFRPPAELFDLPNRSRLAGGRYFLKHRSLQVSDAKNFLAGSQVVPCRYFDELEGRAHFPALFPLSLISSALLEKAASEGYDFIERPLVYTSHLFHVDLGRLERLRDGELLHLLVEGPLPQAKEQVRSRYRCVGLLSRGRLLFTAEIGLSPLEK
jgi:MaoC like domain.